MTGLLTTVAGTRATLIGAAGIIERVGWAQGQRCTLDGRVCPLEAIHLAADGDADAEVDALAEVGQVLAPLRQDLAGWNDQWTRQQHEVIALLRNTATRVAA